jgi:parallel beta helix pectate lyase-like protein
MRTIGQLSMSLALLVGVLVSTIDARAATRYVGPFAYATIQAALDAALSGDTIYVYPQKYNEAISISKSVTIEKWPGLTGTLEIASPSSSASTVSITSFGLTITLSGITLRGGYGAIHAPQLSLFSASASVPVVVLEEVRILYPGVLGGVSGAMNLVARTLDIYYSAGSGIGITGNADLVDVYIYSSQGRGLSIRNYVSTPSSWTNRLEGVEAYDNKQGGLYITGQVGASFTIDNSRFHDNTVFGVKLEHTSATIAYSGAARNKADGSGAWGAGLIALNATASTRSSGFDLNQFGILVMGCSDPSDPALVALLDDTINQNQIMIDLERSSSTCTVRGASVMNLGGTTCEDASGNPAPCQALSSELTAPSL